DPSEAIRLGDRVALRRGLDTLERGFDREGELGALDQFETQAMGLLTSPRTRQAFDLGREDPRVRDRYGRNRWGQQLLLARRLVGATDKRGEDVTERVCSPGDFLATLYHHLGIDGSKVFIHDFNGRPTPIVDVGRPIAELTRRT